MPKRKRDLNYLLSESIEPESYSRRRLDRLGQTDRSMEPQPAETPLPVQVQGSDRADKGVAPYPSYMAGGSTTCPGACCHLRSAGFGPVLAAGASLSFCPGRPPILLHGSWFQCLQMYMTSFQEGRNGRQGRGTARRLRRGPALLTSERYLLVSSEGCRNIRPRGPGNRDRRPL